MNDIFISYARADYERVKLLVTALEKQGWSVWWDQKIPSGELFRQVIQQELENSRCVVVIWSRNSINSPWVQDEAEKGQKRGVLISVSIDGSLPPLGFGQIQTTDLHHWYEDISSPTFRRLVEDIDRRRLLKPPIPKPPDDSHKLYWVVAILAAVVVAAVALVWYFGLDISFIPKRLPPLVTGKDGKEMLLVPAGAFEMGTDSIEEQDYNPQHSIQLDPFYMDKYEVSNGEYELFAAQQPWRKGSARPVECPQGTNAPVCGVSWTDAEAYCAWVGKQLPTEAQWEKAARGSDGRLYPWGNDPVDGKRTNYCDANCDSTLVKDFEHDDGYRYAAPVDSYDTGKSPYGIYNLAGNVWEWVQDWYDPTFYRLSPSANPVNLSRGDSNGRVVRGGSWNEAPSYLRTYYRTWRTPEHPNDYVGFRCVLIPTPGSNKP